MKLSLAHPECLAVQADGISYMGGSQMWYEEHWHRMAGCGPTTASTMVWYLSRSRSHLKPLCDVGNADKASFLKLMKEMFSYIKPGVGGVNNSGIFKDGATRFGISHGVKLNTNILEIPLFNRPTVDELREFLLEQFRADLPVAFLNLSNGSLENLDSWHWVTLIGLDSESMFATICDQGNTFDIDIATWLHTSKLGGALVALHA